MIPDFVQALLDDLAARRQQLEALEAGLRATYGAAESEALPVQEARPRRARTVVPPATPEPVPAARPRRVTPAAASTREAPVEDAGGKYDAGILTARRSEPAQFGLATSDVTRLVVPRISSEKFGSINSSVDYALKRLQQRGQVRRDGRHWYIVRDHEREVAS